MSGSVCAPPDIVLLSTADWDNPFWTNKQHVAVELARRGHRVLYIDSLGLRAPTVKSQDLKRMTRRLWRALRAPRLVRERLWVWSPIVIPWQRHAWVQVCNRLWLGSWLRVWTAWLGLRRELLWTYNPMTLRLLPMRGFQKIVYHCVDEIKAQPGMPAREIEQAEAQLLAQVDVCFVTAEHLLATRRLLNSRTHYFPNVADFEHFARARHENTVIADDLIHLPRPRIGFIGAISGYKLDFALLRKLAQAHPDWSVVLIGQIGEGDPHTSVESLRDLPNLHWAGPRDYRKLPAYLKGFDVAILPAALNEYTAGMFPMKSFEYLAAGCPVVSTDLPALRGYCGVADIARSHDEFIEAIERVIAGGGAPLEARLELALQHTYERRTAAMMKMVERSV